MSAPCPFGVCDGSGFVTDVVTNTDAPCRCRPQRMAAARTRRLEGRIPPKYRGAGFDRFPVTEMPRPVVAEVRRYVHEIERNLDAGRGIWFVGDVGTGKTTLAMLVSKAALDAGRSVAIYSLPRLLNLLRSAIDSEKGLLDLLDRLSTVDLLHVDDVGAENTTDWALEQLYSIVNTRYEDQRAVVVTTNLQPEALAEQIGARTVSRLIEMCGDPLPLFGADKRREYRDTRTPA